MIQKKELTADDVMKLAWTNACPDEEVLTDRGDLKDVEGRTVEVQQKGNKLKRLVRKAHRYASKVPGGGVGSPELFSPGDGSGRLFNIWAKRLEEKR